MIGLPFISELFTNILQYSKGIEGRFFYCPKGGAEINTDDLDQVIKDNFAKDTDKKYPLDIMMPPVSFGNYTDANGEWEKYKFIHFFLTTTYFSGTNQLKNPNVNTRTSTHTILQDQHDMGRCARNFIYMLDKVCRTKRLINGKIRLDQDYERIITPVTKVGNNNLSGVRLDFRANVFNGCALEDYDIADVAAITIPSDDSHPEHQL
jgi:hypothetical protein